MKYIQLIFPMAALLLTTIVKGQDLSMHLWQDRLLVVMAPDIKDPFYQEQMAILRQDSDGLSERRLVVYTATPEGYMKGLKMEPAKDPETEPAKNPESEPAKDLEAGALEGTDSLYQEYKRLRTMYEVVLIGLDGGVKLREGTPMTLEKLFSTVDAMPMRKQEIRRQNK